MKYKAVIFDLDGVICSTDRFHYLAWKKIADGLGIYFDENINQRLRGVSRAESFQIILERYDGKLSEKETERYLDQKKQTLSFLSGGNDGRGFSGRGEKYLVGT